MATGCPVRIAVTVIPGAAAVLADVEAQLVHVADRVAGRRDGHDVSGRLVHETDPRHSEAAPLHGDAAGLAVELIAIVDPVENAQDFGHGVAQALPSDDQLVGHGAFGRIERDRDVTRDRLLRIREPQLDRLEAAVCRPAAGLDHEVVDQALAQAAKKRVRVRVRHAHEHVGQAGVVRLSWQLEVRPGPAIGLEDAQMLGVQHEDPGLRPIQQRRRIVQRPIRWFGAVPRLGADLFSHSEPMLLMHPSAGVSRSIPPYSRRARTCSALRRTHLGSRTRQHAARSSRVTTRDSPFAWPYAKRPTLFGGRPPTICDKPGRATRDSP